MSESQALSEIEAARARLVALSGALCSDAQATGDGDLYGEAVGVCEDIQRILLSLILIESELRALGGVAREAGENAPESRDVEAGGGLHTGEGSTPENVSR